MLSAAVLAVHARLPAATVQTAFALVLYVIQPVNALTANKQCLGCCDMYPAASITRGRCFSCHKSFMADRDKAIAKANTRAVSDAARKLLADLNGASKGEALRPQVIAGFVKAMGGVEKFGQTLAHEYQRCRGVDPRTGLEDPSLAWKPQVAAKFAEIAVRTISQEDDKETFDPASLNDVDLQAVLQGLLVEQIKTNRDFCKALVGLVLEEDPRIVHDAINPPPVEAESVEVVRPDLSEVGLDEKDAGE